MRQIKKSSKTESELMRDGTWLPYSVLLELPLFQVSVFRMAVTAGEPAKGECARLLHDEVLLYLLTLYGWRNGEITSLEVFNEMEVQRLARQQGYSSVAAYMAQSQRNIVMKQVSNGNYVVHTNAYKNVKRSRRVSVTLIPEVGMLFDEYLNGGYQAVLANTTSHHSLFVGYTGVAITTGSSYIPDLFERLTGVRLLCNIRRKAMTSYCLAHGVEQESLARLTRHSKRVQQRSYDMRCNDSRTQNARSAIVSDFRKRHQIGRDDTEPHAEIGDIVILGSSKDSSVTERQSAMYGKVVEKMSLNEMIVIPMIGLPGSSNCVERLNSLLETLNSLQGMGFLE